MAKIETEASARWRDIELLVDDLWEEPGSDPSVEGSEAARERRLQDRLGAALGVDLSGSPIDRPLESALGELLDRATAGRGGPSLGPGDQVGAYRIEQRIGEGGMGTVFAARRADGSFDQRVALKVLHRSPTDEASRRRFLQERQILANLRHPHIARLLDGGLVDHMPYLAMELVEGLPLTDHCRQNDLGRERRLRLCLQACDAVHHAHRQGVIHRDLKPSNLLVEAPKDGEPRLVVLDFGIARLEGAGAGVTATGQVFGTPGYMSPEQIRGAGADVDTRTDVYSLGVVLYEVLSDRRPFDGTDVQQLLEQALHGEPVPLRRRVPDVSVDLATVVDTCLDREPSRRYDSVRALAEDLERTLDGRPVAARPVGFVERTWRRALRSPRIAASIAAAVLVALTSLGLWAASAVRYTRALEAERNGAVAARRDAEELIDFLLQDLYAGLEGVGRLDLLSQAARKSVDYYASRPESGSTDDVRARLTALSNAGHVLEAEGDFDGAYRAFEQNRRLFEALVLREEKPEWLFGLAQSRQDAASAAEAMGDPARAFEHAEEAVDLCRRLEALDDPPEGLPKLFFDSVSLAGWIARETGELDRARALSTEARDYTVAREARSSEGAVWRYRRAISLSSLGLVHQQTGEMEGALEAFRGARKLLEELVSRDPRNMVWREELQLTLARLGQAELDTDRLEAAADTLEASRLQAEHLVSREPDNANWQRELGVVHAGLGAILRRRGEPTEALGHLEKSLRISRTLADRYPENLSAANDLAWDLLDTGRLHAELGDRPRAVRAWEDGAAVMARLRRQVPDSPYYLDTEVQLLLELGRLDAARPGARELLANGWDDPDFLELCRRHGLLAEELSGEASAGNG